MHKGNVDGRPFGDAERGGGGSNHGSRIELMNIANYASHSQPAARAAAAAERA